MLFHNLSLEAFCHATEDSGRVKSAMLSLVPFKVEEEAILVERVGGSFGNDIILLRVNFKKQSQINRLFKHLAPKIREIVDVENHVTDEGKFWVRFDKQKAYAGEITLGREDTIQLKGKVAAFPAKREKAVEIITESLRKSY